MDNFKKTSHHVISRIITKIKLYKDTNHLHYYDLLYSKDNKRIIDDSERIGDPYYSFSKKTSTETMSRIINNKGKITDEVARLIAENMGISYSELVWGIGDQQGLSIENMMFYSLFWREVFYDALLSSKHRYKVIELFKDYIPFSKFIVKNKVRFIS